jgi:hypothetical protein
MFVQVLWLSLAGGVVLLLQGRAVGVASIMFAIAVVAGFRARPIRLLFEAESRSPSLPARMLSAHLFFLLLFALPATVYLDELPLSMMDPGSQRVFIFAGVATLLAAGRLVANLIALRRDRADQGPS